jgi:hypothetical protein
MSSPSEASEGKAIRSWIASSVGEVAFAQLAKGLSGSRLGSLLLEVMRERAAARAASQLLAQYVRDRFVAPSPVDQRTSVALDALLLEAAEGFEAIELSPVAPLGTCSSLALTDQNRVLSALRSTEVVADPTNVLALECARRLRAEPSARVHLTTIQRVVRTQPIRKAPGFTQHFRLFVLASGGAESKDHEFSRTSLLQHIRTMLAALGGLERHGYAFGARRVDVLASVGQQALADRVAAELERDLPGRVARRPLEHGYYSGGLRYQLWATAADGNELFVADGGSFDWLRKLGSNRRAIYVASGAGAQLMALRFRNAS